MDGILSPQRTYHASTVRDSNGDGGSSRSTSGTPLPSSSGSVGESGRSESSMLVTNGGGGDGDRAVDDEEGEEELGGTVVGKARRRRSSGVSGGRRHADDNSSDGGRRGSGGVLDRCEKSCRWTGKAAITAAFDLSRMSLLKVFQDI